MRFRLGRLALVAAFAVAIAGLLAPTPAYAACPTGFHCVQDLFSTNGSYSGSNGDITWTPAWTETNDNNSASDGRIRVTSNALRFGSTSGSVDMNGAYVTRSHTIQGSLVTQATFSFSFSDSGAGSDEDFTVSYRIGTGGWVTPSSFPTDGDDTNGNYSATITIASGQVLTVRFMAENGDWDDDDLVYFDNVTIFYASPAAVALDSLQATAEQGAGRIVVTWVTAQETGNTGFNLWRGTSDSGPDLKLNAEIIPSKDPGGAMGAAYEYIDSYDLVPGTTYTYWLEDVDLSGATSRHAPVSVEYSAPTAVGLSGFGAVATGPSLAGLAGLAVLALAALGGAAAWRRR